MQSFRTLDDVDVKGKRVLLRVDLNVPMEKGRVTDATRLERIAPTILEISAKGGKVILLAHFGRPKGRDAKDSLRPVAAALAEVLDDEQLRQRLITEGARVVAPYDWAVIVSEVVRVYELAIAGAGVSD